MQDCNAFSLISVRSMNPRDPVGKCKKRREKLLGSASVDQSCIMSVRRRFVPDLVGTRRLLSLD